MTHDPFDPHGSDLPLNCDCKISRLIVHLTPFFTCAQREMHQFSLSFPTAGSDHDVLTVVRAHVITSCPSPSSLSHVISCSIWLLNQERWRLFAEINNRPWPRLHKTHSNSSMTWLSCLNSETDSFSVLCLQIPVDLLVSVSSGGNVSWCPDSIIIVASASQLSAGHGSVKLKLSVPPPRAHLLPAATQRSDLLRLASKEPGGVTDKKVRKSQVTWAWAWY